MGGAGGAWANAGATVGLVSRRREPLKPAANAINEARGSSPTVREGSEVDNLSIGEAFAIAADVRNPDQGEKAIAATVERRGKVDIFVNGAAGKFLCAPDERILNGFVAFVDI